MHPPTPESTAPERAPARPHTRTELFLACAWLALQGFGGVMAILQRELVERRQWYTPAEFVEEWAVAQIVPGPNTLNLVMALGGRYFGTSGAWAAIAGMLGVPCVLLLLIAALYASVADLSQVQDALRGMGAVAAGLVLATGLKLTVALRYNVMGKPACAVLGVAAFVAVVVLHLPLWWVLAGVGSCACVWAYIRLGVQQARLRGKQDA